MNGWNEWFAQAYETLSAIPANQWLKYAAALFISLVVMRVVVRLFWSESNHQEVYLAAAPKKDECDKHHESIFAQMIRDNMALSGRILATLDKAMETLDSMQTQALDTLHQTAKNATDAIAQAQHDALKTMETVLTSLTKDPPSDE